MALIENKANRGFDISQLRSDVDIAFACGLIGLVPMLAVHTQNLWLKKHFQFFPIAWALLVVFVYVRGVLRETNSQFRFRIGIGLFAAAVVTAVYSIMKFSPWASHVALILLCAGWMLVRLGGNPWYQPIAWLSLLVVTLPMPRNLDTRLIQSLQSVSSRSASYILDVLDTPHVASGNVLEIRTGQLFVDEACSGVDSLYALFAVGLAIVIWNQGSFLSSVLTLLLIPCWAWLGNCVRLVVIAFLLDRFGIDLSEGWQHTILGLATFTVAYLCMAGTRRAICMVLEPFPIRSVTSGGFHQLYNYIVCFPKADPASSRRSQSKVTPEPVAVTQQKSFGLGRMSPVLCGVWLLLGGLSVMPVFGIGPWRIQSEAVPSISEAQVKEAFTEQSLPATIDKMVRIGFSTTHRERDNINGEYSATWKYNDGDQEVQISIDFPFVGHHGLDECYLLTGHTLVNPIVATKVLLSNDTHFIMNEMELAKSISDDSYCCFTSFDRDGRSVQDAVNAELLRITYQVQIFVDGCGALTATQRDRYKAIVVDVCKTLLPVVQNMVKAK